MGYGERTYPDAFNVFCKVLSSPIELLFLLEMGRKELSVLVTPVDDLLSYYGLPGMEHVLKQTSVLAACKERGVGCRYSGGGAYSEKEFIEAL